MWRVHGVERTWCQGFICWSAPTGLSYLLTKKYPLITPKKLEWGQKSIAETTDVSILESFLQVQQQGEMMLLLGCISASTSLYWAPTEGQQPKLPGQRCPRIAGMTCNLSKLFPSHHATPCPPQHMWSAHTRTGIGKQRLLLCLISQSVICLYTVGAAFTFLVVISHIDKQCFLISVLEFHFLVLHTVIFTPSIMSKMRHQISLLKNKTHSYLDYYLQNIKLQETYLKHNAGLYISILKGHLNLGGKMWRKKRKKSVASS